MPIRFFTRKKIFPGVTLNFSKSGPSVSLGPRGFKHTIGPRGRRTTVGLPGTGLHYTTQHGRKGRKAGKTREAEASDDDRAATDAASREAEALEARLSAADAERASLEADRALLQAILAFQSGDDDRALELLHPYSGVADAEWLCGLAHARSKRWTPARFAFEGALRAGDDLGARFAANGISAGIEMDITPEISAHIGPSRHATRLVLAEACQACSDLAAAAAVIERAIVEDPDDPVLAISLAEIALEAIDQGISVVEWEDLAQRLDRSSEDPILDATLGLYRARAAATAGEHEAAAHQYDLVVARSGPAEELAKTALYERALCLREAGDHVGFRQALSALHIRDPNFADVRALLA